MINKTLRLIGVSLFVCMVALVAVPAFAASTDHGAPPGPAMTADDQAKFLGMAGNLTTSLQGKGVDVTALNAALEKAQSALQNSDSAAFKEAIETFGQDIRAGIDSGTIPKDVQPDRGQGDAGKGGTPPALNTTMETKMLEREENLTASIQKSGIDVSGLDAALNSAESAIGSANTTAFMEAMGTFREAIKAGVDSGSIPKSALPAMKPGDCPKDGADPTMTGTTPGASLNGLSSENLAHSGYVRSAGGHSSGPKNKQTGSSSLIFSCGTGAIVY